MHLCSLLWREDSSMYQNLVKEHPAKCIFKYIVLVSFCGFSSLFKRPKLLFFPLELFVPPAEFIILVIRNDEDDLLFSVFSSILKSFRLRNVNNSRVYSWFFRRKSIKNYLPLLSASMEGISTVSFHGIHSPRSNASPSLHQIHSFPSYSFIHCMNRIWFDETNPNEVSFFLYPGHNWSKFIGDTIFCCWCCLLFVVWWTCSSAFPIYNFRSSSTISETRRTGIRYT